MPMSRMTGKFTPLYGFLIKKHNFGEGHSVFTAIDRDKGKISFLSFGSSGEKSTRRSSLLITNLVSGVLIRKADETAEPDYSLKEISVERSYPAITGDLGRISWCYLVFEILETALSKDEPFGLYAQLSDTMDLAERSADSGKYFLHFVFSFFRSEGILPETEKLTETLQGLFRSDFVLGNGSARFLEDVLQHNDTAYLAGKQLSPSVKRNLIELIRLLALFHFNKELASPELIRA